MTTQHKLHAFSLLSVLAVGACAGPAIEPTPGAAEALAPVEPGAVLQAGIDTRGLPAVSRMLDARGPRAALRDEPAVEAYGALSRLFARVEQRPLRLGVYHLAPVAASPDVLARRAGELGLRGASAATEKHLALRAEGGVELRIDRQSGAELFVDHALNHQGRGVPAARDDAFYVEAARVHLEQRVLPHGTPPGLAPYKVRRYVNEVVAQGDGEPRAEVYQVAVHFNTAIDDLPVIGPGGKVSVHLTVDGRVISHESSVRAIAGRRTVVSGDAVLRPEQARARVEEGLRGRGIDPARFTLARTEFGYLRLGRASVQGLVAPHYAFVYEPRPGETAKRLVETIPAVTDAELLAALDADLAREHARKAEKRRFAAVAPDRRD